MPYQVLMVEDNPHEVELLREALGVVADDIVVRSVQNAREALAYLGQAPPFEQAGKPALILLDLMLPGMSGLQVLGIIRTTPGWSSIPAVIFTAVDREGDRIESRRLGATTYKVKPQTFDGYVSFARSVGYFLRNGAATM
ncbi:MAG: response regulator [Planctomycetes bacterium]|nr:response regulator [Planctomycetota bacterium]